MDKHEKQLWDIAEADHSEWRRLVEDNQELQAEIRDVCARYRLPVSMAEWCEIDLSDESNKDLMTQLPKDIVELEKKYRIPAKFHQTLWNRVVHNNNWPIITEGGQPVFHFGEIGSSEEGKVRLEITPETVVDNPLVLEAICRWQRQNYEPCPQPQPMKGNPRKKDWRPVVEWHKRHPEVTQDQIARLLYVNSVTVRRKLSEFDNL